MQLSLCCWPILVNVLFGVGDDKRLRLFIDPTSPGELAMSFENKPIDGRHRCIFESLTTD